MTVPESPVRLDREKIAEWSEIPGSKMDFCSRLNPYGEPIVREEALKIHEQA